MLSGRKIKGKTIGGAISLPHAGVISIPNPFQLPGSTTLTPVYFGNKKYELSDWLGNVRVVITDKKYAVNNGNTTISYMPIIASITDYYAYGSQIAERTYDPVKPAYRFGFNTQEKVFEITQDHYTAKFWEYDARLGRRWNVDPKPQVGLSNYAVNGDNPIKSTDPQGDCPICPFLADAAVDIAFAAYDVGEIVYDYVTKGKVDPVSYVALTADLASIAVPFSTGAGLLARSAYKALGHSVEKGALKGIGEVLKAADVEKIVIREGKPGKGVVVIGESMERVGKVAKHLKAEVFNAEEYIAKKTGMSVKDVSEELSKQRVKIKSGILKHEESMLYKYNKMWIEEQKKAGKTIIDIGIDTKRPLTKRSPNYAMEVESTKDYGKNVKEIKIK